MFPVNNPPLNGVFFPSFTIYPSLTSAEKFPDNISGTNDENVCISIPFFSSSKSDPPSISKGPIGPVGLIFKYWAYWLDAKKFSIVLLLINLIFWAAIPSASKGVDALLWGNNGFIETVNLSFFTFLIACLPIL